MCLMLSYSVVWMRLETNRKHAVCFIFFFSSRRRHTRFDCDWSSDVCSSDLGSLVGVEESIRQVLGRTLEGNGAGTREVGRRVDQAVEGPRDAEDADELRRQRRATRRGGARRRPRLDDGAGDVERAERPAAGRTVLPAVNEA